MWPIGLSNCDTNGPLIYMEAGVYCGAAQLAAVVDDFNVQVTNLARHLHLMVYL